MVSVLKISHFMVLRLCCICFSLAETKHSPSCTMVLAFAFGRSDAPPDRLMSPAVKGSKIMASPMRPKTAAADSALGEDATLAVRPFGTGFGFCTKTETQ